MNQKTHSVFGTVVDLQLFLKSSGGFAHLEETDVPVLFEQIDGLVAGVDGTVLKRVQG